VDEESAAGAVWEPAPDAEVNIDVFESTVG
jgi:hypothetical protein